MTEYNKNVVTRSDSQLLPMSATGTEQARAIAEVQAAIVVAKAHPRDENFCHTQIMKSCQRKSLAEKAVYAYKRGSTLVTGPSIALAETIARCWGNINYGFREISRSNGASVVESFAHDIQTNTKVTRTFTVKHWRDTKSGGYALKEERDIYELVANMAQRRVRACLLEVVPRDIVDDAEEACNKTIASSDKPIAQQVSEMLVAFDGLGITQENIEDMLQRSVKSIIPADIVRLKQVYTSIKNGVARREEFFDLSPKGGEKLNDIINKSANTEPVEEAVVVGEQLNGTTQGSSSSSPSTEQTTEDQSHASSQNQEEEDISEENSDGKANSDHPDHPFNRSKWISIKTGASLQSIVKDHPTSWTTTTPETKYEFYQKWKRILKSLAVKLWPFENMEDGPVGHGKLEYNEHPELSFYVESFANFANTEELKAFFIENNNDILNHMEKDAIIKEYDKFMDSNKDETDALKTTQDFLNYIYHAKDTGELSALGMKKASVIETLDQEQIYKAIDDRLADLNRAGGNQ